MKLVIVIALVWVLAGACSRPSENAAPAHRYALTGKVVSVNSQDQTATIDAAAIPNFMGAMTMAYPIHSRAELNSLHAGDRIAATVNVFSDGDYYLSDIKVQPPAK